MSFVEYRYITTDGLPPLNGIPPVFASGPETGPQPEDQCGRDKGCDPPSNAASKKEPGNVNKIYVHINTYQPGCHPPPPTPPPYCSGDPPPPYRSMCVPTGQHQSQQPPPKINQGHVDAPGAAPAPGPQPLPIGAIIPGTKETPLVIPQRSSSSNKDLEPESSPGFGYIFPKYHTTIHLIEPEYVPFNHSSSQSASFRFHVYKVPTSLAIAEFMDQIFPNHDSSPYVVYSRGIIECIELGNGCWGRGQEFWIGGNKGRTETMKVKVQFQTLADIGWNAARGTRRAKPVWLATTVVWE